MTSLLSYDNVPSALAFGLLTGLASWYIFNRENDPDFKQSYVTLSGYEEGKQTEGEHTLVDKLKVTMQKCDSVILSVSGCEFVRR